ncbi:MAG: hypothetical protein ACREKL_00415 [Chthoniobacterales bacterium]
MNPNPLTPIAILLAALLIAGAIYLRPQPAANSTQAFYGNGTIYIVDLQKKEIANMIPAKQ